MTFQLLIACMNQVDKSLLEKSNIQCDAVVVNQCDEVSRELITITDKHGKKYQILWVNSTDRGLSRSRNLAFENATADICMIADDDQLFDDNMENRIVNAYTEVSDVDVLIFAACCKSKQVSKSLKKISYLDLLRVCSVQISFRRESINGKILFDPKIGAGTGNGAGEETKFLVDCYNYKCKIFFYPTELFKMRESNTSTWFYGMDSDFFYKRGMVNRYVLGLCLTLIYTPYFLLSKRKRMVCSPITATMQMFKGCFENKLKE